MPQLNFNAAQVQPQKAFEPVPNNWYNVVIDESDIKPTNSGTGAYLALRMNIIDGDYANQKLFCRLNIQNENEKTVEIAYQQLSAICHATNTIQVNDSTELHNKPFQVKVIVKPPSTNPKTGAQYDASNEFKGFKACEGVGAATGSTGGDGPSWAGNNNQGNAGVQNAGGQQQDAQQDAQQNTAEDAAQSANSKPAWNQDQKQEEQPANNNQATVEETPAQDNGGDNKMAPWMKK